MGFSPGSAAEIVCRPIYIADMGISLRTTVASAATALALMGSVGLGAGPAASAKGTKPPPMHISASGGDKTAVDSDGTQGAFASAVQGKVDSDGDQDAFDEIKSEEAKPQDKAPHRMTK